MTNDVIKEAPDVGVRQAGHPQQVGQALWGDEWQGLPQDPQHLPLYPRAARVEQVQQVLHQLVLLGQVCGAGGGGAERLDHREQLKAVDVAVTRTEYKVNISTIQCTSLYVS